MPFGDKVNVDIATIAAMRQSVSEQKPIPRRFVKPIDFDRIFENVIRPAAAAVDLDPVRCDKIKGAGSIHEDMFDHIRRAEVVVVDISTLNANVFYELGVRHALQKNVTVLIQRKGTQAPFNIHGYRIITYDETTSAGVDAAVAEISAFIRVGLKSEDSDSPIYKHLPLLRVTVASAPPEQRILEETTFVEYSVSSRPGVVIGFVTGDIARIRDVDVWVNSENVSMQMARFHDPSISGAIRWLGARKHPWSQAVEEDTIALQLAEALDGATQVDPGVVVPTSSGSLLETNGVKRIYHAAAVTGQPRRGYRPVPDVGICINNALELLDREGKLHDLTSIAFPLLGSGAGGRPFPEVISAIVRTILAYLEKAPYTRAERIYMLAPIAEILADGMRILDAVTCLERAAVKQLPR
jgi:O-acetyl-ADP-ribose deacetylase (regulator of RNase III)